MNSAGSVLVLRRMSQNHLSTTGQMKDAAFNKQVDGFQMLEASSKIGSTQALELAKPNGSIRLRNILIIRIPTNRKRRQRRIVSSWMLWSHVKSTTRKIGQVSKRVSPPRSRGLAILIQTVAPVMVWLHGGGYAVGWKSQAGSPGGLIERSRTIGNDGIIYVGTERPPPG